MYRKGSELCLAAWTDVYDYTLPEILASNAEKTICVYALEYIMMLNSDVSELIITKCTHKYPSSETATADDRTEGHTTVIARRTERSPGKRTGREAWTTNDQFAKG
jgi:hypothetical protein